MSEEGVEVQNGDLQAELARRQSDAKFRDVAPELRGESFQVVQLLGIWRIARVGPRRISERVRHAKQKGVGALGLQTLDEDLYLLGRLIRVDLWVEEDVVDAGQKNKETRMRNPAATEPWPLSRRCTERTSRTRGASCTHRPDQ